MRDEIFRRSMDFRHFSQNSLILKSVQICEEILVGMRGSWLLSLGIYKKIRTLHFEVMASTSEGMAQRHLKNAKLEQCIG